MARNLLSSPRLVDRNLLTASSPRFFRSLFRRRSSPKRHRLVFLFLLRRLFVGCLFPVLFPGLVLVLAPLVLSLVLFLFLVLVLVLFLFLFLAEARAAPSVESFGLRVKG